MSEQSLENCKQWMEEFKGRCLTCYWAQPTNRKMEMDCLNNKAWDHGLSYKYVGGGTKMSVGVHKLFGCVYWQPFGEAQRKDLEESKQVKSIKKEDSDCPF